MKKIRVNTCTEMTASRSELRIIPETFGCTITCHSVQVVSDMIDNVWSSHCEDPTTVGLSVVEPPHSYDASVGS